MLSFQTKSFPNNEFRALLTDLPLRLRNLGDGEKEKKSRRQALVLMQSYEEYIKREGIVDIRDRNGTCLRKVRGGEFAEVAPTQEELDIIYKNQTAAKKVSRGIGRTWGRVPKPIKFSARGKRRLLQAGGVFDNVLHDTHSSIFVTFTLPGSTPEAYQQMECWSGYLQHAVTQRIRQLTGESLYFLCWEYQKRGALHMHLCFGVRKGEDWQAIAEAMKESWYNSLSRIQKWTGVNMFLNGHTRKEVDPKYWQFDAQPARKSCAAYISKYVSKSHCMDAKKTEFVDANGNPLQICGNPHRWWIVSNTLVKMIEDETFVCAMKGLSKEDAAHCMDAITNLLTEYCPGMKSYRNRYNITSSSNRSVVIGTVEEFITYCEPGTRDWVNYALKELMLELTRKVECGEVKYSKKAWNVAGYDLRQVLGEKLIEVARNSGKTLWKVANPFEAVDSSHQSVERGAMAAEQRASETGLHSALYVE